MSRIDVHVSAFHPVLTSINISHITINKTTTLSKTEKSTFDGRISISVSLPRVSRRINDPGQKGTRRDTSCSIVSSCRIHGELTVAAGSRHDGNNRETSRCRVQRDEPRGRKRFPSRIIYTTTARIQTIRWPNIRGQKSTVDDR